jgi:trans-aconitate 2-methyltransferase
MAADTWNPAQYERFRRERSQPFYDLLAMVRPRPAMRLLDLGCGTGELTKELHLRLEARETLGLDTSEAMLAKAASHAGGGLRFEQGDITTFAPDEPYDLIFSNAALHWLSDHPTLLAQLSRGLAVDGQLAVQVPANEDHLSHVVAREVASEPPFKEALSGHVRVFGTMPPERYAMALDELGFREQTVLLRVYGHHLPSRDDVVEWVRGTLLTDYQRRLSAELFERFLARYRQRLLPQLADTRPYFYPFKRVLFWAGR